MQKAFSFDSETIRKIAKGAWHSLWVAAALGLLEYAAQTAGTIHTENILATMALTWLSGAGYNTAKEWIKGQ